MTEYFPPIPSRATKQTVFAFAESLRKKTKLANGFQLAELVAKNKGTIEHISFFDADQTDAIIVNPDESFTIRLSAHTHSLRDHFTIAHEIGHKLMHWPLVRAKHSGSGMKATRYVDEGNEALVRCEWEANWFASAFLMPEAEFRVAYANGNASEVFGVTDAAVRVRAKSLGIPT